MYTLTDELVQPVAPTPTAALAKAPNSASVAVQDVCPGRSVNHISLLDDAVTYAIVLDALHSTHPANGAHISRLACARVTMPGLTAIDAVTGNATTYAAAGQGFAAEPGVHAEPPLAPYAR